MPLFKIPVTFESYSETDVKEYINTLTTNCRTTFRLLITRGGIYVAFKYEPQRTRPLPHYIVKQIGVFLAFNETHAKVICGCLNRGKLTLQDLGIPAERIEENGI